MAITDTDSGSPAGEVQIGYEIGNALGRLNADLPFVGKRCTEVVEYARILRYVLNAIDGYQDRSGESLDTLQRHIRNGRLEVRCIGNRITVVVPG